MRRNTCAPLAETLRLNGYARAHVGKCHEVVRIDLGHDSHDHLISWAALGERCKRRASSA